MMLRTAALIVGGGPAGATAARFLAEESVESILVERDLSYVKPCGGGIPSGAFGEFSLPQSIVKKTITKILIVSPEDRRIEMALQGGAIHITERGRLDSVLRQMAQDRGALLIEGEFIAFEREHGKYISRIIRKDDHTEISVQSDYILAADGITFRAGRKSGRQKLNRLYTISARLPRFDGDACEFWFGTNHASHFYSWIFPSSDDASIGTGGLTARECPDLLDRFLRRRFDCSFDRMQQGQAIGRARIFPIPVWKSGALTSDNMLFIGDAAGMVMPVTYEGIYYAMKSGQFAASAICERRPEVYRKLWQERFGNRFMIMDRLKHHFFRDDKNIEKWIGIHNSSAVQELAMRLWLQKQPGNRQLLRYLKAFGSLFAT